MEKKSVLVVDDERSIRSSLKMIFEYEGYSVEEASDGVSAISQARRKRPDIVLLDIKMPGMDGLEVLETLNQDYPDLPIIILSGHGNVSTAVQATKLGAYDFLEKPLQRDRILLTARNALHVSRLEQDAKSRDSSIYSEIIGKSQGIKTVDLTIKKVASSTLSVLIRGESGTGKELVAKAIHHQSDRSHNPFVQVNCAAIPEDLIESELFGHEKGSFTGASDKRQGKFELAHTGTLFLDEIGDMSIKTQAKVLRALQEGEYQRVGGAKTLHADVRLIAATNKDLEEMIRQGEFREDLYFRINVVPIEVPPLRERLEDLPLLVNHFSRRFTEENGLTPVNFMAQALKLMAQHSWPGNIRELKNFVERLIILSRSSEINADDVSTALKQTLETGQSTSDSEIFQHNSLQEFKETAEKEFLIRKLMENNWNIKATAESIGTPRSNLYKRMNHYRISRESIEGNS